MIVHKQQAGSGIARDKDIGPAIFIKIRCDDGHSIALGCYVDTGLLRNFGESPVAIVAVERMPSGGQPAWPAVDRDTFPIASRLLARNGSVLERKTNVVRNEEI